MAVRSSGAEPMAASSLSSMEEPCMSQNPLFLTPERGGAMIMRPLPDTPSNLPYPNPLSRPAWYDRAHRSLKSMVELNQTRAIAPENQRDISAIAQEVIGRQNSTESLLLLKLLAEYVSCGIEQSFFAVSDDLCKRHREIQKYFYQPSVDHPELTGPGLTVQAICQIFQIFIEKYHYPAGKLCVQPVTKLPDLIKGMLAERVVDGTMYGWAVYNDHGPWEDDPHIVPVFVLKKEGCVHVFIFDSLGHCFSKNPHQSQLSASLTELINYSKTSQDLNERVLVYSYKPKRQYSEIGCSIFSILDLKNLLERHGCATSQDIVDFYASQQAHKPQRVAQDIIETELPVHELTTLPPEMMKVMQSFTQLAGYQDQVPVIGAPVVAQRLTCEGEHTEVPQTLEACQQAIHDATRVSEKQKPQNFYVQRKRLKYIVYLLGLHIKDFAQSAASSVAAPSAARSLVFS